MAVTGAAELFELERQVRERAACGRWHEAALHTVRVTTPYGECYGRDDLVGQAVSWAHALNGTALSAPWILGAGDLAVWSARLSSHHAGTGALGPGTGARVDGLVGGLARLAGGRVAELWNFDDTTALAAAGGVPVRSALRRLCQAMPPLGFDPVGSQLPPDPAASLPAGLPPAARAVLAGWLEMIVLRRFECAGDLYADGAVLEAMAGRSLVGPAAIVRHWLGLTAAVPDLRATVLEVVAPHADTGHAALLWQLSGTHQGPAAGIGRFALPVLSQFRIADGRIAAERLLLDEAAIAARLPE